MVSIFSKIHNSTDAGLHRDDILSVFKNIAGHQAKKIIIKQKIQRLRFTNNRKNPA